MFRFTQGFWKSPGGEILYSLTRRAIAWLWGLRTPDDRWELGKRHCWDDLD